MLKFLTSLLLVATLGCSHTLVYDPLPQAINSRYYNVEYSINNKAVQGGDVLLVDKSSSPSDYELNIYGPDRGVIYLASKRCGVDKSLTYLNGQYTTINLGDLFASFKNCILEITVVPSYKDFDHDKVSVAGQQGLLYIRVLPDNSSHSMKVKPSNFLQLKSDTKKGIIVESTPNVDFAAFGCLSSRPKIFKVPESGIVTLETEDLHGPNSSCLIQLKDKSGGFSAVVINVYDKKYQPLAEPIVVQKDKSLHIEGDKYVTLTDVNGKAFHGNKAKVKYAPGITYSIRQYTTKGRAIFCKYSNNKLTCNR